jgi:hypothetical protein
MLVSLCIAGVPLPPFSEARLGSQRPAFASESG